MNWKKLKRVIIPLLIIKIIIFVIFIFKSDLVSISRDISNFGNSQVEENGIIVQEKQKLIRIVRNEPDRGITIQFRRKRGTERFQDTEAEPSNPVVD